MDNYAGKPTLSCFGQVTCWAQIDYRPPGRGTGKPIWLTKHETATRVRQRLPSVTSITRQQWSYELALTLRICRAPKRVAAQIESGFARKQAKRHSFARYGGIQMATFIGRIEDRQQYSSAKPWNCHPYRSDVQAKVRGAPWSAN